MEEEKKFKVGDVVRLNSGGPPMTVGEVAPNGALFCTFYNRDSREFTDRVFRPCEVHATKLDSRTEYYA